MGEIEIKINYHLSSDDRQYHVIGVKSCDIIISKNTYKEVIEWIYEENKNPSHLRKFKVIKDYVADEILQNYYLIA